MDLDHDGVTVDLFRRGRQVMMPDESSNGRLHRCKESELRKQDLRASCEARIHEEIDIAHWPQAHVLVQHMGERGALQDNGVDSGGAERVENFPEHAGEDLVAAAVPNGQRKKLTSNVRGKLNSGTTEVLVKERSKAMCLALLRQVAPVVGAAGQERGERGIRHVPNLSAFAPRTS